MKFKLRNSGYTVVFYRKEGDKKLSFFIENEPELTEKVLSSVKTKRVKQEAIKFALPAIDKLLITDNNFKTPNVMNNNNPIVELTESIQELYGQNIEFTAPIKDGPDHCPTVTVSLLLPNGKRYTASGSNQRLARQECARKALQEL